MTLIGLLYLWIITVASGSLAVATARDDPEAAASPQDLERAYEEQELNAKFDPISGKRRYDRYQLLSVTPSTDQQLKVLRLLEKGMIVDFWDQIPPENITHVNNVSVLVGPDSAEQIKQIMECSGMEVRVVIGNLQEQIDQENTPSEPDEDVDLVGRPDPYLMPYPNHHLQRRGTFGDLIKSVFNAEVDSSDDAVRFGRHLNPNPSPHNLPIIFPESPRPHRGFCYTRTGMTWTQYHRWDKINQYLDCLAADHPDKVQLIPIGETSEQRQMRVLKLGRPSKAFKPAVWIDGGIHAREWVSPAAVLYAVRELVENEEDTSRSLLNFYDIYILPVANPDGYEYSHEKDRLWRKTRSWGDGKCRGVDPNRNWGHRWGGEGASSNPCHETFRGIKPFSEPETAAIRDFIMQRSDTIKMYLTFHSYGQYVLYPWGYAEIDAVDVNDLHQMATVAAQAMERVSGRKYLVGSAAKLLYPASGGSDDWAKGGAGIKYSFTIELPDQGNYGFILPAQYIEGVGQEVHAAIEAMIGNI